MLLAPSSLQSFHFITKNAPKVSRRTIAFHKYAELCNLKIIRKDIWLFQGIYIFHLDLNELVMYVIGSKLVFTLTMSMYTQTAGNTDSSPSALPLFKYTKFCNPRLLLRLTYKLFYTKQLDCLPIPVHFCALYEIYK